MPEPAGPGPVARMLTVPAEIAGLVVRRAVSNARAAAAALDVQTTERRELAPRNGHEPPGEPGEIARLSRAECMRLLATKRVGRLAYVARATTPDIVPVNFAVSDDGSILVRSGRGPKLQAAERGDTVAFEVDDIDEQGHTGWSVVVVGRARRVPRDEAPAPDADALPWVNGPRHHVVAITPTRIEGRRLT